MNILRKRQQVQTLSEWLDIATRKLTDASKERIWTEIEAHYTEAVEAHRENGLSELDARKASLIQLGDARAAAKHFRKRHLTEREEKTLKAAGNAGRSIWNLLLYYGVFLVFTNAYILGSILTRLHNPWPYLAIQFVLFVLIPTTGLVVARHSGTMPNRHVLLTNAAMDLAHSVLLYFIFVAFSPFPFAASSVICSALAFLPCLPRFLFSLHLWMKLGRLVTGSTHPGPPNPARI